MTLNLQEVDHIARLARLALSDAEKALFAAQLSSILEYAARLRIPDVGDGPPSDVAEPPSERSGREDQPLLGLENETLLKNAPQAYQQQFRVPSVFD